MVLFVISFSLILIGIAICASGLVIGAVRPTFYVGFLRRPNRTCCNAVFQVIFVSLIMEMLILSKTLFYENENITKLLLETDYLQEMADTYPDSLILSLDDYTHEISIDHNKMSTPFVMNMPVFYTTGINIFLTYLASRYSVNPTLVQDMLPNPRILFVNDKAMQLDYLDKHPNILKNKHDVTIFDNWWTLVLNVDKNNKRVKHKKQKILLFDRLVEMEYSSHFNHLDTFVKMFCKKTVSTSSASKFKYRCSKDIVTNKLFMIKKVFKQKRKESVLNTFKAALPSVLIALVSIGLFFMLTFLESSCVIIVMSLPTYAICCLASYRNYRGYGFPSYFSVLRLCCYTFTLYGLVWAVFGDLFAISKFDVDQVGLYKDLIFIYVIWTFSCCRQAIIPVVVIHRQQGNVIIRRNNDPVAGNEGANNNVVVGDSNNTTNNNNNNRDISNNMHAAGNQPMDTNRRQREVENVNNDTTRNRLHQPDNNLQRDVNNDDLISNMDLPPPHESQQQYMIMMMNNPHYQRQLYQYFYYSSLYRLQMEYHHKMQQQQFHTPEKAFFK